MRVYYGNLQTLEVKQMRLNQEKIQKLPNDTKIYRALHPSECAQIHVQNKLTIAHIRYFHFIEALYGASLKQTFGDLSEGFAGGQIKPHDYLSTIMPQSYISCWSLSAEASQSYSDAQKSSNDCCIIQTTIGDFEAALPDNIRRCPKRTGSMIKYLTHGKIEYLDRNEMSCAKANEQIEHALFKKPRNNFRDIYSFENEKEYRFVLQGPVWSEQAQELFRERHALSDPPSHPVLICSKIKTLIDLKSIDGFHLVRPCCKFCRNYDP